jgi:serine/threonine protein kinase
MPIPSGSRLGPYEIQSPLGAGGMGEVYRARDTRLERTVALKVLPAHLSTSPEVRQRFEREAKTISQLSHPHICALYDVGNQDGVEFLVMEYLEGETLSERLAKGPLAFDQVLRYGLEIADALDKAHRQGIVHRDLKPGNVMLTKSGVKLLDFGLAKAVAPAGMRSGASLTALPTQTGRDLTAEGTILGTFQYMAPEQLEGKEADGRTDIFAFGAVLYEMATGKKAFSGRSQASLISSIMTSEPTPVSTVAPTAPPAFDRVVRTCLAKDPDDRWQTAHDIAVQLRWIQEGGSATGVLAPPVLPRTSRARPLPWIVAGLTTAGLLTMLVRDLRRSPPAPTVTRFSILPPEKTIFTPPGELSSSQFALSPDGRSLAFVANPLGSRPLLWVRALDSLTAVPLAGTEDALHPFWSPDGRSLAFFTPTSLKRVEASGGTPQKLCDALAGRGGAWSSSGVIVFASSANTPLSRVPDTGGEPEPATKLDASRGEDRHRFPFFLPDGRRFLFWARTPRDTSGICVASLDSRDARLVLKSDAMGEYALPGYLLTVQQGMLVAYPFDEKSARVRGQPIRVAESVLTGNPPGYAPFAVSGTGLLAYSAPYARGRELVWLDRSGRRLGNVGEPGDYSTPRLSPDEKRIAVAVREESKTNTDIWLFDSGRGAWSRLTFEPANERAPIWSPDGSRIVFTSASKGVLDLYENPSSGSGGEPRLFFHSSEDKFPTDWSRDGRFVVYHTHGGKSFWDLWVAPTDGGKPFPFLSSKFTEVQGQISPDGRWIAYTSDESGRLEIYVTQFPEKRGRWQISTSGGAQSWWRADGKELFYLALDQTLMSVAVRGGEAFEASVPTPLFKASFPAPIPAYWRNYVATGDGQRFLVSVLVAETAATPINVVMNWTAGLRK